MKSLLPAVAMILSVLGAAGADRELVRPFEIEGEFTPANPIDDYVLAGLLARGITPANLCSDQVFVRRVFLDVIGTLPEPREALTFLQDQSPDKRAKLIDMLLERQEFADYWSLKWCDLLRVKAEFPINLWPNAVQAYHRWIHDAIRDNQPYDAFARALLTSSGSNFRVPPVNFYRAVQGREPEAIAAAVALTFLGVRIESWPENQRRALADFFSRIAYKETSEWKEEIVILDPAQTGPLSVVFPDGVAMEIEAGEDPRRVFALWLTSPDNPWFARNIVNRIWSWLFGRGIVHEPDDIRPENPPVYPELLSFLERELANAHYDLRHIYRLILNSRTYQQSSIPKDACPDAERFFACYAVRRLEAEVLADALSRVIGAGESYSSAIPEPFTFMPGEQRSILLADGSISSSFLEMFGRPSRDTGLESERNNEPTDAQRLFLLNSTHIQNRIENSPRMRTMLKTAGRRHGALIQGVYMGILCRYPTQAEADTADEYFKTGDLTIVQAGADLAWALINTKEFLYRH